MKICMVTDGTLADNNSSVPDEQIDVLIYGFHGLGEVDYSRELSGETSKLEDLAVLSRELSCVVISGCYTDSCGIRQKSAAIADRGKILGVSELLHSDDERFKSGAHLKVYETSAGKLGLCVGEDLFYPSVAETLALFDADAVFCVFGEIPDFTPQLMLRADAFCAGIPMCMCARGIAQIASAEGEILLRSVKKECRFNLDLKREYRLVTVRTRGLRRRFSDEF